MATPEVTSMAEGGASRHIACKGCRDRKVRCGGEQPICEKCRRAGEPCLYLHAPAKPTKADLAQRANALQKRLSEGLPLPSTRTQRAYWLTRNSRVSPGAKDEAEAYIAQLQATTPSSRRDPHSETRSVPHSSSSSSNDWDRVPGTQLLANVQNSLLPLPDGEYTPSAGQVGGGTGAPGTCASFNESSRAAVLYPSPGGAQHQGPTPPFPACSASANDTNMNLEYSALDFFYPHDDNGNGNGNTALGLPAHNPPACAATLLTSITAFTTAIFRTQAEASVMASVVADYIAWLRKAPTPDQGPVYQDMLATLEKRLRELGSMSQTRSNCAVRELVTELEGSMAPAAGGDVARRLGGLEKQLADEWVARAKEFRARYNPCAFLTEQDPDPSR